MLSEKVLVQTSRINYKRLEASISVYYFIVFVPTLSFTFIAIINQIINIMKQFTLADVCNLLSALTCVLDGTMPISSVTTLEGLREHCETPDTLVLVDLAEHIDMIGILRYLYVK